jgi:hypothetical protein
MRINGAVRILLLAVAATWAINSAADAAVMQIFEDTATQYTIVENAQSTGIPAASLIGNGSGGNYRVGAASGTPGSRNPVYMFAIPTQSPAEPLVTSVGVTLGVASYASPTYASGPSVDFNGDLYVIGTQTGGAAASRITRFNETDSALTDTRDSAASIKIQDNLMTPTTDTNYQVSIGAAGEIALADYLNEFYASNPAYDASVQQRYLSLRVNPDLDISAPGSPTNNNGYNVVPANPANQDLVPLRPYMVLTTAPVPEPATASILLAGLICLARRPRSR